MKPSLRREQAPSDEGAVSEADWGRDNKKVAIHTGSQVFCKPFSPSASLALGTSLVRGRYFIMFLDIQENPDA